MLMYCPGCGSLYDTRYVILKKYDDGSYICPGINCGTSPFEIDEYMIPIIKTIWEKGYATIYSCSGHIYYNDTENLYVVFDVDSSFLLREYFNTIDIYKYKNLGIKYDFIHVKCTSVNVKVFGKALTKERINSINEGINTLLTFVEDLPDRERY